MKDSWNPKSSFEKRIELVSVLMDSELEISAEEWLEKQGFKIEDLTDSIIERLIDEIKQAKKNKSLT